MEKMYYQTFPAMCKQRYGRRLYRVALDAGMSCPNRDGKLGTGGCIFCDEGGSGDFAIHYEGQKLDQKDLIYNHQKAHPGDYIAYFQSYTNTYAPVERLEKLFRAALSDPLFAGISIATRPDCLGEDVLSLLQTLKQEYPDKYFSVELGLQTIHEDTAVWMRRGYPLAVFDEAVRNLKELHIEVIVHVILGLKNESLEMILDTIHHMNALHIDGIKLQLLHYLKDTDLGKSYLSCPEQYHVLSKEEYTDWIVACIANLNPSIVIHRLTGDGAGDLLIEPRWSRGKGHVLNLIRHKLAEQNITQGCLLEQNHPENTHERV